MKTNLTEIAFVLDRSGSMGSVLEPAITGFNTFLREQKEVDTEARFTLVLFDDQYEVLYQSIPLGEVVELDTSTFVPRGSTALLDAMGRTIDELGARLAATPEASRPATVIVAVLTDGFENASQHFTWKEIAAKIARQRDKYKWEFFFLGANQDAIATAAQMSIAASHSSGYVYDAVGMQASYSALSLKTAAIRARAAGKRLSAPKKAAAAAPLHNIVAEEDASRRKNPEP